MIRREHDTSMNMEEEENGASSVAFTEALVEQVKSSDVASMVEVQREIGRNVTHLEDCLPLGEQYLFGLSRYEKTNEMLINFNMLSSTRFEATNKVFREHTELLYDMKKDLDAVFRRIRSLKQRLGKMYPEAFSVCSDVYNLLEDEEEDDKKAKDEDGKDGNESSVSAEDNG